MAIYRKSSLHPSARLLLVAGDPSWRTWLPSITTKTSKEFRVLHLASESTKTTVVQILKLRQLSPLSTSSSATLRPSASLAFRRKARAEMKTQYGQETQVRGYGVYATSSR